jgi:methionine synthase I (cobalamin-dependent)
MPAQLMAVAVVEGLEDLADILLQYMLKQPRLVAGAALAPVEEMPITQEVEWPELLEEAAQQGLVVVVAGPDQVVVAEVLDLLQAEQAEQVEMEETDQMDV